MGGGEGLYIGIDCLEMVNICSEIDKDCIRGIRTRPISLWTPFSWNQ